LRLVRPVVIDHGHLYADVTRASKACGESSAQPSRVLHHDASKFDALLPPLRTTLTLDPDVASLIDTFIRDRGLTFKQAVNAAMRAGLAPGNALEFHQRSFSMGSRPDVNYDRALLIAAALETEEFVRKFARGGLADDCR